MLRASAAAQNISVNLDAVTNPKLDSGITHGSELLAFADAVTGSDHAAIIAARTALRDCMGPGALVEAAAIAGNFSKNDRASNAMGIPLESVFLADTADFRERLGIDGFQSARNTLGS
ncbi:MAG: hypothetical protein ACI9BW_003308 [Gammaproteobacteria bacterium]|jgi:hypothetical protein